MGARGPKSEKRADKIQLGAAYAFYTLYPEAKKYKNFYVLHERDYYSDDDSDMARRKRAVLAEIKIGKKLGNGRFDFDKLSDDPRYELRKKNMNNQLKRIDEELGPKKLFPIKAGIDKEKLIHMIFESYPDPAFFLGHKSRCHEWTGELMHSLFSYNGIEHRRRINRSRGLSALTDIRYEKDYAFVIRSGKGGIIKFMDLPFSIEDYTNAIESYIESATVQNLHIRISSDCQVYKLAIVPYYENSGVLTRYKKYDATNCLYFNIYKVGIKPGKMTKAKCTRLLLPGYKYLDSDYIVMDSNNERINDRTIFPLTAIYNDDFILQNRRNADADVAVIKNEIEKIKKFLRKTRWKGSLYKVKEKNIVIKGEDLGPLAFIMKKTVLNAKIAKDIYKYQQNKK